MMVTSVPCQNREAPVSWTCSVFFNILISCANKSEKSLFCFLQHHLFVCLQPAWPFFSPQTLLRERQELIHHQPLKNPIVLGKWHLSLSAVILRCCLGWDPKRHHTPNLKVCLTERCYLLSLLSVTTGRERKRDRKLDLICSVSLTSRYLASNQGFEQGKSRKILFYSIERDKERMWKR